MPHLTTFRVLNLSIGTEDLLRLLLEKMPSLRHLALRNFYLRDGRWEGIIEALRVANRLKTLELPSVMQLVQSDVEIYPPDSYRVAEYQDFLKETEKYVVDWPSNPTARHPSLQEHQPIDESLDFLKEALRICARGHVSNGKPDRFIEWISAEAESYQRMRAEAVVRKDSNDVEGDINDSPPDFEEAQG